EVKHPSRKETGNTPKTCHRCEYTIQTKERIFKCPKREIKYDRDLNACVNIVHRAMSPMGWRSPEPPELSDEIGGVKHQLNARSPIQKDKVVHVVAKHPSTGTTTDSKEG
ncbi:TPA: hypothetical protein EYP70_04600, partial [Candidatus Bathyarchaeota archaeon]|nr:hypothetical protein [Candidatus Bathyarchaeota archaeon]